LPLEQEGLSQAHQDHRAADQRRRSHAALRVSTLQAIYNARGYCRCFDQLTSSQQMALSQLVYQMGVNLQEFNQFLDQINNYPAGTESASSPPHHYSLPSLHGH